MDTLNSVISMISPEAYFASLDLKHAYYTILVALEQRIFLKFLWLGNLLMRYLWGCPALQGYSLKS